MYKYNIEKSNFEQQLINKASRFSSLCTIAVKISTVGDEHKYMIVRTTKPNLQELKETWLHCINEYVQNNIINGFEWNGMYVYLDLIHQFDYKLMYDYAKDTNGGILPLQVCFGDNDNLSLFTFTEMETFNDFYECMLNHIKKCLSEGWQIKTTVDWKPYEELLNK